jgi:glycerol dehydrogenase-like iron-containing ADH family enzyme
MIPITGYKQIDFSAFIKALNTAHTNSGKSHIQIAAEIDVKAAQTATNAFRIDKQVVSDEVLTNVMKAVRLSGLVIWIFGKKYYYLKEK